MKKRFFQVCSFFLSIAILISMLPMSVFAEELQEAVTNAQTATESTETTEVLESSETYVVDELEEKRTEFSKEFLLSNGLHMAAVYADAVHYETDSGWKEIDNTLKTNADGTLSNTAGVWDVSFPQQLTEEDSITIEKDGYTLSFSMAGELTASGAALMTAGLDEEVVPFSVTEVQTSNAQVQESDTTAMEEAAEYPETVPDKVQSQVSYANVYENTDVVYDLNSNQVKESIILESYSEALQGYRYTLDVGTMIPVLEDDGQITFYDADRENVVLVMPAPYLVDDAGAYNDEIQVQLTGSGSSYTMLYILPQQWLTAEDRAWPVVLDPIVDANLDRSNIRDRTVAQFATYGQNWGMNSCGYAAQSGIMRSYLKYDLLPSLTSSDVIISASISMYKSHYADTVTPIEVHKVNDTWLSESITWDNKKEYDPNIEDYAIVELDGWYSWVVTDIVRDWYANENTGMMFKASDTVEAGGKDCYKQFLSSDFGTAESRPCLSIVFRNNNGTESYWDYTPSSAGRAGTGYINNFTGNLTWIRNDIGFDGNRMPVSISHVYNLNDAVIPGDTNNSNDSGGNSFGMGIGWRTNYNQLLYRWEIDSEEQDYYIWEDEDGTDHYFELNDGEYKDEDGLELTLTTNGSGTEKYRIFDKYGNSKYFDTEGRLTKLENNQETPSTNIITYKSASSKLISSITDGAGRVYTFVYNDDGLLTDIKYQGDTGHVSFGYTGDKLTSVTDKDNKTSRYAYTDNLLTSATDIDGYYLQYTYYKQQGRESWQPYRVKSVCEYDGTTQGGSMSFEYGHNQTVITDHNKDKKIIQFNDFGNPTCIQDGEGRAQFCEYAFNTDAQKASNEEITAKGNQLRATSDLQYTTSSLLLDGGMYFGDGSLYDRWYEYGFCNVEASSYCYADSYLISVDNLDPDGNTGGITTHPIVIAPGETQTFSCFVKPRTSSVYLKAVCGNETVQSETEIAEYKWQRMQITYTNKSAEETTVTYQILTDDNGSFFVDCAQLERAEIASRYNLINNGDFNCGSTYGWTRGNSDNGDGICVLDGNTAAPQLDKTVYRIAGNYDEKKNLSQKVRIYGKAGDSLMLSGWAKGNSAPLDSYDGQKREFALQCIINYADGTKSDPFTARFNPDSNEWQYAATAISAKQDYYSVNVYLVYNYNVNTVYFDGIQLNKDEGSNTFTYDENGNVVSAVNAQGEKTSYEYQNNNLTKELLPTGVELTYEYDDYHNVKTASTKEKLTYSFAYDEFGNNTSVSISATEDEKTKTITSTAAYTDDGNYMVSSTDALGNTTKYNYDSNTGVLHSVEQPAGDDETAAPATTYTYDNMLRMTKATLVNGDPATGTMEVAYTYENDRLTGIDTATTLYTFGYGDFGLRTTVSAGNRTLATYNYEDEVANGEDADKNYDLDSLAYGNGHVIEYKYDDQGRITEQIYKDSASEDTDSVTYKYDTSGAVASVSDSESGITSSYCYDLTDRLQKYMETGVGHSVVLRYNYDDQNRLSTVRETINGWSRLSKYSYNKDNQIETFQKAYGYRYYEYDKFGRLEGTVTKDHDAQVLQTAYSFKEDETKGTTTNQISKLEHRFGAQDETTATTDADLTFEYTYDERGNITSVTGGGNEVTYEYDLANQLTRENNQKAGKTWTWTYDAGGNITSRKEYAYTTDALGTDFHTVSYGYESEKDVEKPEDKWGDLLTSYNNVEIKYDQIGNPEAIRGWTIEWQHGRELASMSKDGVTWNHTYNADGLRVKRTNGTDTYSYVYDGGTLLRMKLNGEHMMFSHTPEGTPLAIVYNDLLYYYVTNAQGDVVALLDTSGNKVVEYTYDAWGNDLGITGSLSNTLGQANPLRYRGYVYDQETGLYYLQSRYYDPELGRFINSDSQFNDDLLGFNLFSYCGNNPVSRSDDKGEGWWVAASAIVGGIAGAVTKVASNLLTGETWYNGVVGAAVGGAVYGGVLAATGSFALAGFSSAAAESVTNALISYTPLARYNGATQKEVTALNVAESALNVTADTIINGTAITVTGKVAGMISPTNNGWFQPQKLISSFVGKYAIKSQIQTGVQSVMLVGVELVKHGMDLLFEQAQQAVMNVFP